MAASLGFLRNLGRRGFAGVASGSEAAALALVELVASDLRLWIASISLMYARVVVAHGCGVRPPNALNLGFWDEGR